MKRWAILVAALYLVILMALTMPVLIAALYPFEPIRLPAGVYFSLVYWILLAVMILGQTAMLLNPDFVLHWPGHVFSFCPALEEAPPECTCVARRTYYVLDS